MFPPVFGELHICLDCIWWTLGLSLTSFIVWWSYLCISAKRYPDIYRAEEEKYFKTESSKETFPSLFDDFSVHLSVVVPAYDEEVRLPPMLDECLEYLQKRHLRLKKDRQAFQFEVIIVSDGSKDKTVAVAEQYTKKYGSDIVRVLDLKQNRGKGGAVRLGVYSSRGAVILFADADGATKFSDISELEAMLEDKSGVNYIGNPSAIADEELIVCGSRAHLQDEAVATRSWFRTLLMHGFHWLVWTMAVRGVEDTQCGFKLFTRQAARTCFQSLHVEGWAFDVELLYIAQSVDITIIEVGVNWTEIEGSKIVPIWSWLRMGLDLWLIWMKYQLGIWRIKGSHK